MSGPKLTTREKVLLDELAELRKENERKRDLLIECESIIRLVNQQLAEARKEVERLKTALAKRIEDGNDITSRWMRCCEERNQVDEQLAEANKLIAAADPLAWCVAGGWNIPAAEWKERQAKWFESVWFDQKP